MPIRRWTTCGIFVEVYILTGNIYSSIVFNFYSSAKYVRTVAHESFKVNQFRYIIIPNISFLFQYFDKYIYNKARNRKIVIRKNGKLGKLLILDILFGKKRDNLYFGCSFLQLLSVKIFPKSSL